MPLATVKPLTAEEKKRLVLIAGEMQARGIQLPDIPKEALAQKSLEWPLDERGYFLSRKGRKYNPKPEAEAFVHSKARFAMFYGGRGSSKALDIDTLIPTPTGFVRMGDIQVGDIVYAEDGTESSVTFVSPRMFGHKCWELTFDDGSTIIADDEHWWKVLSAKARKSINRRGVKNKHNKISNRYQCQPKYDYEILTTGQIVDNLVYGKRGDINYSVDLSKPIIGNKEQFTIHPYAFGYWLGDGTSRSANVTIGDEDIEVATEELYKVGISLYPYKQKYSYRMQFHGDEYYSRVDGITGRFTSSGGMYAELKKLEVLNNKHIPVKYLRAGYWDRLALLQGLMDTDGCITLDGRAQFTTSSYRLALDFKELCSSLSLKVAFHKSYATCNGDKFVTYKFAFVPYIQVFRFPRKATNIKIRGKQSSRRFKRYIVKAIEVPSVPVQCIAIDHPSHMYLATASFIPTHNTCSGSQKALKKIMQGQNGAVINPDFENFCLSTWPEFKEWIPWEMVVPSQRNRESDAWQPTKPFVMVFLNGCRVYCKGLKDPDSARGPNLNWVWYDESGRDETGAAWQLIIPSVRIGTDPQAWCTQTAKPPSHWSYKFFIEKDIPEDAIKAFGLFGLDKNEFIQAFHLSTQQNSDNLDPMFYASLLATYHSGGLRERELNGNFVEDGGKIGDSSKLIKVTDVPEWWKWGRQVRYWDMAGTEKKLKNGKMNDPDEAVGTRCLASDEREPKYCFLDQVGGYWSWDKLKEVIAETAIKDGPTVTVVIEQEPGSGGKNQCAEIELYFKEHPKYPELKYFKVERQLPTDRVQEAYVWFGYANAGNVYYIDNVFWNKPFIEQIDGFTFMLHDDRVTSASGAVRWLSPAFKTWKRVPFVALQG